MLRGTGTAGRRRSGFTLIEIMVVLLIISVLVALLVPAVFKVQDSVKKSDTAWRMTQISQAADLFATSELMGKVGYLPSPPFRLQNSYPALGSGFDYEINYLRNVFPNLDTTATGFPTATLDGNQIAVFFLTGGPDMLYQGFSMNPKVPYAPPSSTGEKRKGPFLQLKDTMYESNPGGGLPNTPKAPWLIDAYRVPFAIFTCGQDKSYQNNPSAAGSGGPRDQSFTWTGQDGSTPVITIVRPYVRTTNTPFKFENPKGIQIISAGRDKVFGPGQSPPVGTYVPTSQPLATLWPMVADNKYAMDDASNFSVSGLGYGPN